MIHISTDISFIMWFILNILSVMFHIIIAMCPSSLTILSTSYSGSCAILKCLYDNYVEENHYCYEFIKKETWQNNELINIQRSIINSRPLEYSFFTDNTLWNFALSVSFVISSILVWIVVMHVQLFYLSDFRFYWRYETERTVVSVFIALSIVFLQYSQLFRYFLPIC